MPNSEVAGSVAVSFRRRVKYEKSSVDLDIHSRQLRFKSSIGVFCGERSYVCTPSDSAMNGSKDQSLSTAGLVPSSAIQSSISGPLSREIWVS